MFTVNDCTIAYLLYTVGHCLLAGEVNNNPMVSIRISNDVHCMNYLPIKVRLYETVWFYFKIIKSKTLKG